MSAEVLVEGYGLIRSWLQDRIEQKHQCRPLVQKVEPLGPEAIGYMSVMRRVLLEWDSDRTDLPKSVIIKIPCANKVSEAFEQSSGEKTSEVHMDQMQKYAHGIETKFYQLVQTVDPKPLLVPLVYAAEDFDTENPVIVMEDYYGCSTTDPIEGFSEKQLFSVAEQVVNLQAFSIENRDHMTPLETSGMKLFMVNFSSQIRSICEKLLAEMPEKLSCIKTVLANTLDKDPNYMIKLIERGENEESPRVLVHGDLWGGQILWRDSTTIAGIVDWQIAHMGSPLEDLLRVLSMCTSPDNRRKLLHPILDYYYEKLTERLGEKVPFTREYLNEEYVSLAPYAAIWMVLGTAIFLKSENIKKTSEVIETLVNRCKCFIEDTIKICDW